MARILIAGMGNIFQGDDGFGVEVAKRLAGRSLPPEIRVVEFGVRGVDLARALLEDYTRIILVDAVQRGGKPGTLYLIEPRLDWTGALQTQDVVPAEALNAAKAMGAKLTNIVIVGCEPESFGTCDDPQLELSPVVRAAVDEAVQWIESMAAKTLEAARA